MTKQLFAKVGVFALIVVNLGAYYVFWPDATPRGPDSGGPSAARPGGADKLESPGKPIQLASTAGAAQTGDKSPFPAFPSDPVPAPTPKVPTGSLPPPAPLTEKGLPAIPPLPGAGEPPPPPKPFEPVRPVKSDGKSEDPTIELLKKLKDRTAKPSEPVPAKPAPPVEPKKDGIQQVAAVVADPVPAKTSGVSPWSLQMELAGAQKVLTAKLHKRTEFRILCDQVEMKTTDGAVAAVGKVSFTAPGLKGTCQRLTIGLGGDSITLEGKAELQVQQGATPEFGGGAAELRGEQFTLRLQPPTGGILPTNAWPAANPVTPIPSTPTPFPPPRPFPLEPKVGK